MWASFVVWRRSFATIERIGLETVNRRYLRRHQAGGLGVEVADFGIVALGERLQFFEEGS